jgi:hypothetical protein
MSKDKTVYRFSEPRVAARRITLGKFPVRDYTLDCSAFRLTATERVRQDSKSSVQYKPHLFFTACSCVCEPRGGQRACRVLSPANSKGV